MHAPADGQDPDVPLARDREADHVVAGYLEREDEPQRDEAGFGRDGAAVPLGPEFADEVEEEVADGDAEGAADDGRHVQEGELVVG